MSTSSETHKIYALCDPLTGEARYIGVTVKPLHIRRAEHLCAQGRCHRTMWIKRLREKGFSPSIELISEINKESRDDAEKFWIVFFKGIGCSLVNSTEGGGGLSDCSPEVREKIRLANTGKKRTPETIERHRIASTGKRHTEESRNKMSHQRIGNTYSKGKMKSLEHRRKISEALIGHAPWNKGIPHSNEARAKISAAKTGKPSTQRGVPMSDAQKTKLRAAMLGRTPPNKGKKMSDEQKKKQSAAMQGKPSWNKGLKMPEIIKMKYREAWVRRRKENNSVESI